MSYVKCVTSYILLRHLIVNTERGPLICTLATVLLTKECIIELILLSFRKKLNLFTKLVYKQIGEALQRVK